MKKRNLVCLSLAAILLSLSLSGCCGGSGKETIVTQPVNAATQGQQLQDLKTAYDQGALSQEEFNKAKEKILKAE